MHHHEGYLDRAAQEKLLGEILAILALAPVFTPRMPRTGKPFSVRMSNCGPLGWVSDAGGGYRYQATHPVTGEPWPPMPRMLVNLWDAVTGYRAPPEACLINVYGPKAKMGLHRDDTEQDLGAPVVSVSLGDTALFRAGGLTRKGPTESFDLKSGDVVVLSGASRLRYHGIDRVRPGTSDLIGEKLPGAARINLTLRRATKIGQKLEKIY